MLFENSFKWHKLLFIYWGLPSDALLICIELYASRSEREVLAHHTIDRGCIIIEIFARITSVDSADSQLSIIDSWDCSLIYSNFACLPANHGRIIFPSRRRIHVAAISQISLHNICGPLALPWVLSCLKEQLLVALALSQGGRCARFKLKEI